MTIEKVSLKHQCDILTCFSPFAVNNLTTILLILLIPEVLKTLVNSATWETLLG